MKRHLESSKPIAAPAPTCWQREAPCACLRLEPSGREAHIFPYQHLITASLTHADGTDTVRLSFASHEVELVGRNLRELVHGLQEFTVKWVRLVPERYQLAIAADAGVVTAIRISETS